MPLNLFNHGENSAPTMAGKICNRVVPKLIVTQDQISDRQFKVGAE